MVMSEVQSFFAKYRILMVLRMYICSAVAVEAHSHLLLRLHSNLYIDVINQNAIAIISTYHAGLLILYYKALEVESHEKCSI